MPFNFKPSQFALQDLATAEPGTIGWIVESRRERARLIMIITRPRRDMSECLFVELSAARKFVLGRIGNIGRGIHFMLKMPYDWRIEIDEPLSSAGGVGGRGAIILATAGTYLVAVLGSNDTGWDSKYVRFGDFVIENDLPDGMKSVIGSWRMAVGNADEKVILIETQEPA